MIRVLVVDDSPVARELLIHILESDPGIKVVGTAGDGGEAVAAVREKHPDVVTMDFNMPVMNGCEATRIIMETNPVPVIIVSANLDPREVATNFRAMEAGALAIIVRPSGIGYPDHERTAQALIRYVKAMAEVPVVRRWPRSRQAEKPACSPEVSIRRDTPEMRLVAIGASTGGPIVIQQILAALSPDFPAPVLVVQHMARGFIGGFVGWLVNSAGIDAKVAQHGERVRPGCTHVAPDGFNMGVDRNGRVILSACNGANNHCPSVSHLFRSVAESYGETAVGVLLTGMGRDGAEELLLMKERGGVTIAQDKASSVVYGMPGAAARLDAAAYLLPPDAIAKMLQSLADRKRRG